MTDPVSCPACGRPLTPIYDDSIPRSPDLIYNARQSHRIGPRIDSGVESIEHQGPDDPALLYWKCDRYCGILWTVDQIREHLEKTEHAFGDPIHG